jgi:hypothetical protein
MLKNTVSTLLTGLYAVYKAEWTGTSSLDTSVYSVYNAESNANDSYGSNNGTFNGTPAYTTGIVSNAFSLNGSSYVEMPDNSHEFTSNFSFNLWIKLTSLSATCIPIANYTTSGVQKGFFLSIAATGAISFQGYAGGISVSSLTSSGSAVTTGTWYMLTIVYTSGSGVSLYKNGSLLTTGSSSGAIGYNSTSYPTIGANKYTSSLVGSYVTGSIDAVTFWSKALTFDEVEGLYNTGSGIQYPFSNNYLPSPKDSYASYDGTAQGGLTYSSGKSRNAFTFNGTNAYVSLPTNSMNFTGDFSISTWVYVSSYLTGVTYIPILWSSYAPSWYSNPGGFRFDISGNQIEMQIGYKGSSEIGLIASYPFAPSGYNQWYHIVMTRKASTRTRIYVNSSLINSDTNTIDPIYYANTTPAIGAWVLSGVIHEVACNQSAIDELYVYNKELTSTEVTTLYNAGTGKFYPTF